MRIIISGLVTLAVGAPAFVFGEASTRVIERSLHSAVMEHVRVIEKGGQQQSITNRYTTLATGLHRMVNGELVEADSIIELEGGGAIADKTQHKVKFSANINDWEGAIEVVAADETRFLSRPLGISYYDTATEQSVLIAELKDSTGLLFAPNKIVYPDAFTDFEADLEYNNMLAGLQQNLIFRECPPAPAEFGLNNETTVIELLTEFFEAPVPVKKTELRNGIEDDRQLDFGGMKMGVGKSFMIGEESRSFSVQKQWTQLGGEPGEGGRTFLIERVTYAKIAPLLKRLPLPVQAGVKQKSGIRRTASKTLLLPKREIAKNGLPETIQIAQGPSNRIGFLIDYSIVTTSTDFTFTGTTYVPNVVNLDGTTVFEAGAVLKYTNGGQLQIHGPTVFKGTEYRPTVFTGKDDNSVGETIHGSTGSPVGNIYGGAVYFLLINSTSNDVRHIRVSYARMGIEFDNAENGNSLRHSQFIGCNMGLSHIFAVSHLKNVLMFDVRTNFLGIESALHAEHLTVNRSSQLCYSEPGYTFPIRFTNSLLVAVTNIGTIDYNTTNSNFLLFDDDPGVFISVGAGSHYLPDNSGFRNIGTTSISPALLADLKNKTTYPPLVLTNLPSSAVLAPRAQRDNDIPDLGYHYDPLDYAISNASASTVVVTNGAAIGFFGNAGEGLTASTFISEGSPLNPNRLVWYNTVQEQSGIWNSTTPGHILTFNGAATVKCRFTDFSRLSSPPGYGYHFVDGTNGGMSGSFSFQDCRFSSGLFRFQSMTNAQGVTANLGLTNCLFERVNTTIQAIDNPISVYGFNNHFQWGSLTISTQNYAGAYGFTFRDNLLFQPDVTQSATVTNSHNGVWSGLGNRFIPTNAADVVFLTEPEFTNGPLGSYYQVITDLINKGSRNADVAGLYHFTTTTDQVKETNSVVDIGFHYVAVDILTGLPFDTDGEGLSDYFEDTNGNGTHNTRETNWQNADTDGDGVNDFLEWLQGRSGTVSGTASGAALNLNLFTPMQ